MLEKKGGDKLLYLETTWMELTVIVLSEINQIRKTNIIYLYVENKNIDFLEVKGRVMVANSSPISEVRNFTLKVLMVTYPKAQNNIELFSQPLH